MMKPKLEKKPKSEKKKAKTTKPAPDQKMMRDISITKMKQIDRLANNSSTLNSDDAGIKIDIKGNRKGSPSKKKPVKAQSDLNDNKDRHNSSDQENSKDERKKSFKTLTHNKNSITKIKEELARKRYEKEAIKVKIKIEREKARRAVEQRREAEKELLEKKIKEREAERIKKKMIFEDKKSEEKDLD